MKNLASTLYSERWIPSNEKTRVYCTDESRLDQQQQDRLNNRYKQTSKHVSFLHKYPNMQFPVYFFVPFFGSFMFMYCIAGLLQLEVEMLATTFLVLGLTLSSTGILTSAYAIFKPHIRNALVDRFNNRLLNTEIPGINTETDLRFKILRKVDDNGTLNLVEQISKNSAEHPSSVYMQGSLSAYLIDNQLLAQEIKQTERRIHPDVIEILSKCNGLNSWPFGVSHKDQIASMSINEIENSVESQLAGAEKYRAYWINLDANSTEYYDHCMALKELKEQLESYVASNSQLFEEYRLCLDTLEANAVSCLRTLRGYVQPIEQVRQLDQKSQTDLLTASLRIAREITQNSY